MEASRVAEVLRDGAVRRSGSGYLVASGKVLTAWHVVRGATSLSVRLGGAAHPATLAFTDKAEDLAVLDVPSAPAVARAPLGLPHRYASFVEASVAGYPWWKRRPDGSYALAHEQGSIAVHANHRERTLQLTVDPPQAHPHPDSSPWQGISGGPVFADGRLVGVLAWHHPREGLNRLTAARVDACPELVALLGSPHRNRDHHLRELTPLGGLLDRDRELAAMASFCSGCGSYLWWQAGPWAGKSALMAAFALAPPPNVEVVPFFVRAAVAAEATSDAFTQFLLTRLAYLNGEGTPTSERDANRVRLLEEVAERLVAQEKRLVLLVDGLDEDLIGEGIPSIASLLPRRPPLGLHVIVASRPHPDLPDDVAEDHPLRTLQPTVLAPSPHAADFARLARLELRQVLGETGRRRDIIGFVAAGGGGLTVEDLEDLTGTPYDLIADALNGVLGRTLRRNENGGYAFAHETLLSEARSRLGERQLASYRDRIIAWAEGYRENGWPEDTPTFLFGPYFSMLGSSNKISTLVTLVIDRTRQARMLARTGGEANSLGEIRLTQTALLQSDELDLESLTILSIHRENITTRNLYTPTSLPAIWAELHDRPRAFALIGGIDDGIQRMEALQELAIALARQGDFTGTAELVREVEGMAFFAPNRFWAESLRRHAIIASILNDPDLLEDVRYEFADLAGRDYRADTAHVQSQLALTLGELNKFHDAVRLIKDLDVETRLLTLFDLMDMAAKSHQELLVDTLKQDIHQARSELERATQSPSDSTIYPYLLCRNAPNSEDDAFAELLMEFANRNHKGVHPSSITRWLFGRLVQLSAHSKIEHLINSWPDDWQRAEALTELSRQHLNHNDLIRAYKAALEAEKFRHVLPKDILDASLEPIFVALSRIGDIKRIKLLASTSSSIASLMLETYLDLGDPKAAEAVADSETLTSSKRSNLCAIIGIESLSRKDRERLAKEALQAVVGHEDEPISEHQPGYVAFDAVRHELTEAFCQANQVDRAIDFASEIRDPGIRERALNYATFTAQPCASDPPSHNKKQRRMQRSTEAAHALAYAAKGEVDKALKVAADISMPGIRSDTLVAIAKLGYTEEVAEFARMGKSPIVTARILLALAGSEGPSRNIALRFLAEAITELSFEETATTLAELVPDVFQHVLDREFLSGH